MPELFDGVFARGPFDLVNDVKLIAGYELDCPGVRETLIATHRDRAISFCVAGKLQQCHFRFLRPAKWTGLRSLIVAVDANRVMGRRSAKSAAPFRIHITVGTGIDEDLLVATADNQRQRVRVTVAAASGTERTGIEQGEDPAAAHDDNSAVLEQARPVIRRIAFSTLAAFRSKPPYGHFVRVVLRV